MPNSKIIIFGKRPAGPNAYVSVSLDDDFLTFDADEHTVQPDAEFAPLLIENAEHEFRRLCGDDLTEIVGATVERFNDDLELTHRNKLTFDPVGRVFELIDVF